MRDFQNAGDKSGYSTAEDRLVYPQGKNHLGGEIN